MNAKVTVTAESGATKTYTVTFVVDGTRPTVNITGPVPNIAKSGTDIKFTATYTGAANLDEGDIISHLSLNQTGTLTGSVRKSVVITGNVVEIIVTAGTGDGTLGITLAQGSATNTSGSEALAETSSTAKIDNTAPTGTANNNPAGATNGNVAVTITASEDIQTPSGWTKTDNTHYTKTYSANTTETVTITDLAGNTGSVNVSVANIDKAAPTGTASYSTTLPTNSSVTATITSSEEIATPSGWTKTDDTHYTKVYSVNTTETVTITDLAGNTGSVNISIANIDGSVPTGTVSYSITTQTNGSVTATITASEEIATPSGWTKVDDTHYTKEYTANTTETVTITDLAGSTGSVNVSVTNIDKTAPTGTAGYNITTPTNGNVTATITTSEEIQVPAGWTKVNATHYTKPYSANTTETVTITDLAGNTGSVNISISNIDKTLPTGSVGYSTTVITNEDVTATITASEPIQTPSGWTKVDDTTYTKEYSANGTETVTITDLAGNTGSVNVSVANIDKTTVNMIVSAPDKTVVKQGEQITYLVTYTGVDANTIDIAPKLHLVENGVTGSTISVTHNTGDDHANIVITAGTGSGTVGFTIDTGSASHANGSTAPSGTGSLVTVDNTLPTGSAGYSVTTSTSGNVTVTITTSEPIQTPSGWTKVNDTTYTKIYTANGGETVAITDLAGNTGSVEVSVANIDKTAPTSSVSYSTTTATNGSVTATITTSEEIQTPAGWTKVDDTHYEKVYSANATETVTIKDLAGNTDSVNISIANIDDGAPTGTVGYSTTTPTNVSVTATITTSEEIQTPSGWTKVDATHYEKVYSANTTETVTIEDFAGNTGSVNISIANIDAAAPTGTVGYSTTTPTSGSVTATITTSEEIQTPAGWTKIDATHYEKVYSANDTETVTIEDLAGNTDSVSISISNIDSSAPTGTVSYSPTAVTTGSVTATIIASEPIQTPSGWTKIDDVTYEKVYPSNTTETVTITDLTGNTGTVNVSVTNIDNTPPTASAAYSTTNLTNGNVTATITASKPIKTPSGWTKVDDVTYTKEYSANAAETVALEDNAGNTGSVNISISNIDKTLPTGSVSYSETASTEGNVTVTITTDEPIQTPSGWTKVNDTTYTKEYTANVAEPVTIEDMAGNTNTVNISITNIRQVASISIAASPTTLEYDYGDTIDLTGLVLDVTYTDAGTATITYPDSGITIPDGTVLDTGIGDNIPVEIDYKGSKATFNVKVNDVLEDVIITGPTNTSYQVGDTLDKTGITITEVWVYSGNVDIPITTAGVTINGYNTPLQVSDNKVTVSYKTKTENFPITVADPVVDIEVTPNKTTYKYGESLDIKVESVTVSGTKTDITGMETTNYSSTTLGNQTVTVSYGGFSKTITVNVIDYVTGIVLTKPTENKYNIGESLDLTGGKVKETMASGVAGAETPLTLSMIEDAGTITATAGGKNVKVNYTDTDGVARTAYFPVLVTDPADTISLETMPKTDYNYGQGIDLSQGSIKVKTLNGEEKTISLTDPKVKITGYNGRPSGFTAVVTDVPETLTITYTENFTTTIDGETITETVTKTTTYGVVVHDFYAGIALVAPDKTVYTKGEELDLTGGKIQEKMASGVVRNEVDMSSPDVTGYNKNTVGTQTLTVAYGTETKTFTVKVENPVVGISIVNGPDKTEYKQGENLDLTGGTVQVTYKNGETKVIDLKDAQISGYDKNKVGNQVITVTVDGKTAEFAVNVTKKQTTANGGGGGKGATTPTKPTTPEDTSSSETPAVDDTTDVAETTNNNINNTNNEQSKNNTPVVNKSDENGSQWLKGFLGIIDIAKENIVPIIAFGMLIAGAWWLLLLLAARRKNVEIYTEKNGEQILVDKLRITKDDPRVAMDNYKKGNKNKEFEVILKKSIAKKLDKKQVTLIINGQNVNYKVNYKNKECEIKTHL